MKSFVIIPTVFVCMLLWGPALAEDIPLSEASAECIDCHASIDPGIVSSWQQSRHAVITPQKAMAVEGVARKVSSTTVPENLRNVVVGCAECHTLRPKAHADTFEHVGYDIHVVVSPDDCQTCHATERKQYAKNIMAHAYGNLAHNKLHQKHEDAILASLEYKKGKMTRTPADDATRAEACYYCHGTKLALAGHETRDTEAAGEMEFPIIKGWPNQGVGRINLDGSIGACSACHTRHAFSIETARKPYTCKECHVGPDVPAYKVYAASKHGNLFSSKNADWNFKAVPWTIGQDFTAPTCATCHISLLVNTDEQLVVERTHQMNNRLPWRILGLIYAHPHPAEPDTSIIRNKAGMPLPTDFEGGLASKYLIDEKEMGIRRQTMQAACLNCHDTTWINGFWKRFENTLKETNAQTLTATKIMQDIWQLGLANRQGNPFDEAIEKKWSTTWLFYANTIRFASAMAGGGDYGVFAGGRYQLSQTLLELNDWLKLQKKLGAAPEN